MSEQREIITPAVAIVGGGPAGLSAATALRRMGIGPVVVLEREAHAGGVPRHSDHTGYGVRDLRSVMSGPSYAERLVRDAREARADIRTSAMVTDWAGDRSLMVTSPAGRIRVDADAIVLATGARERPRPARMVPGDRPAGVMTTGQLQQVVHGEHEGDALPLGARAVVIGAELVSWSAVMTLRSAGCPTALMTSEHARLESPAAFTLPGRAILRVAVSRGTRLTRIIGRDRVEAVEIERIDSGHRRLVECDTVVFTGDWVPDNELARLRGLEIDDQSRGPLVDTALRTSEEGIFAAGNLLHPVDTADVAALDGRHVAGQVQEYLAGSRERSGGIRVLPGAGCAWVAPGLIRHGDPPPPRDRVLVWPTAHRQVARVVVEQGGRTVARRILPWAASPGRVLRVPWALFRKLDLDGSDAVVSLR